MKKRFNKHFRYNHEYKLLIFITILYALISPVFYVSTFAGKMSLLTTIFLFFCVFAVFRYIYHNNIYVVLISTVFISSLFPNELIGFVAVSIVSIIYFLILIKKSKINKDIEFNIVLYIFYLFLLNTFHLGRNTDLWSLPLYAFIYITPIIFGLTISKLNFNKKDLDFLSSVFIFAIFFQLTPLILKPIVISDVRLIFMGSDLNHGTLTRAHYLGVLMAIISTYFGARYIVGKDKRDIIGLLISFYSFLITDSKHLWAGILPGALLVFIYTGNTLRFYNPKKLFSIIFSFFFIIIIFLQFTKIDDNQSSINAMYAGLDVISVTNKAIFIERTFDYMLENPIIALFGIGPGSYGSRVASARANDILYKQNDKLPDIIPSFYSDIYAKNIKGLYTYNDTIKVRSKVLFNPFSDLVGLIAELGLIGFSLLIYVYIKIGIASLQIIKRDNSVRWKSLAITSIFTIPFIFSISLFGTYIAKPSVIIPIWFLYGLIIAKGKE